MSAVILMLRQSMEFVNRAGSFGFSFQAEACKRKVKLNPSGVLGMILCALVSTLATQRRADSMTFRGRCALAVPVAYQPQAWTWRREASVMQHFSSGSAQRRTPKQGTAELDPQHNH